MKFKDLKKSLNSEIKPIYLICGDDAFLQERAIRLVIDACKIDEGLNLSTFEGQNVKGEADLLISALTSYPFMGDKRVVLIKEFYPLSLDVKSLKSYFENPCETTVFIIANLSKSDALSKLSNVTEVDCAKGDQTVAEMWIKSACAKGGVGITKGAIDKLIDYCNSDMTKINGEIEKLIAYALNEKTIDEEAVETLCVKELEYQTYQIVEFIASKKYESAYKSLTEITTTGDGQKLFVSLYYHFSRMLYSAISPLSDGEVAKYLKIKEFAVKMARRQARAYPVKRLKQIVDTLSRYDADFKQGLIDQSSAVWNAIFNVLII